MEKSSQTITVREQPISTAEVISGQLRIANAGNAIPGPNVPSTNGFYVKAHPDNTDTVWIGNDGGDDVTNNNGYPLDPGEQIIIAVGNLHELVFDSDVDGGEFCWIKA